MFDAIHAAGRTLSRRFSSAADTIAFNALLCAAGAVAVLFLGLYILFNVVAKKATE